MAIRASVVLLSLAAFACAADNWPAWRGPTNDGIAPGGANPPTRWDDFTNIKWKAELPGRGSATPIVWGEQIFIVTAIKTDRVAKPDELPKPDPRFEIKTDPPTHFYRFEVLCYDRATGTLNWRKTAAEAVPHEGHHATHSYAAGSPTTDGQRLYVSFGSFGIYAFDLKGELLWKRDLGRLHTRLAWGEAVTPVIHVDTLLLNWDQEADSKLIALEAATGKTKWQIDRAEKTSWNTPFVVKHGSRTQVIVNGTTRARAYDLADGKVIWEVGGMTVNAIPSPLVANDVAYIVSGYRGSAAVAVSLDASGDLGTSGKVLWRYGKGTPYVPSPLLYDGRIYMTQANTQILTVLDAKTGKVIVEGERLPKATSFYASPIAAGGRVYFVDREGTTVVLAAGEKAEVLSTNKLSDRIDASPVVIGKTLYLRGEKHLYAIEEGTR